MCAQTPSGNFLRSKEVILVTAKRPCPIENIPRERTQGVIIRLLSQWKCQYRSLQVRIDHQIMTCVNSVWLATIELLNTIQGCVILATAEC
jgi:hypothetical protein